MKRDLFSDLADAHRDRVMEEQKRADKLERELEHCRVLLANALCAMRGRGGVRDAMLKKQIKDTLTRAA